MVARFPYGGNGGTNSEVPEIGDWLVETVIRMKSDPRIDRVISFRESDTPITMVRNLAVQKARERGADLLVMIDSDTAPDYELKCGDKTAKRFWESSFDFVYNRKMNGLTTVIGAPYCGPPPAELPYVFKWANYQSDHPNQDLRLEMYSREEAAIMGGIQEVAALPTGLIIFDMAALDLTKPDHFYYEYANDGQDCSVCGEPKPGPRTQKASTEDVTATRDISLMGIAKLGYNPLFCNWDAWAGHWKPKCVGKPKPLTADRIGHKYKEAVLRGHRSDEKLVMIGGDSQEKLAKEFHRQVAFREHVHSTFEKDPEFAKMREVARKYNGEASAADAASGELNSSISILSSKNLDEIDRMVAEAEADELTRPPQVPADLR